MAIYFYSGLPGTGKTASATFIAVKQYKSDNSLIKKLLEKRKENINLVYSNYPILLDLKRGVYSNSLKPGDLCMKYQFPHGSLLILDEFQRYYDSREFKTFPKDLGTFFQHHRHGSIKDIILISQHPRRVDNKGRDLSEIFRKHKIFLKIPFLPVIFCYYTNYYEFEDYGKYNHLKKEQKTYDYDNHMRLYWTFNIFNRYNSKYFAIIFEQLPEALKKPFTGKSLTIEQINDVGISTGKPKSSLNL
jgi:zona occludens toxin (predicted ATPase)